VKPDASQSPFSGQRLVFRTSGGRFFVGSTGAQCAAMPDILQNRKESPSLGNYCDRIANGNATGVDHQVVK